MTLGEQGENVAAQFLAANSFRILQRNFRTRSGEIDIIAQTGRTIVFVEVKTRSNTVYGQPAEYVTRRKQERLLKAALYYLHSNGQDDALARFDVVEVIATSRGLTVSNHIINAFGR